MEGVRNAGLLICILMVLMAYFKQAIPKGKNAALMKGILSIFILLSIVSGVRNINWQGLESLLNRPYSPNNQIEGNPIEMMQDGLKEEFQRFLSDQEAAAMVEEVKVGSEESAFSIERVLLFGEDGELAARLLSARYGIDLEKIEVSDG